MFIAIKRKLLERLKAGKRVALIDIPYTLIDAEFSGTQVSDWHTHVRTYPHGLTTKPADLASRMEWIQFLGLLRCGEAVAPILRAGRDEALSEVALTSLASLGLLAEDALDVAWERLDARACHDASTVSRNSACTLGSSRINSGSMTSTSAGTVRLNSGLEPGTVRCRWS